MGGGGKTTCSKIYIYILDASLKNVPNNENNILIPIAKMHKRTDNIFVERLICNAEDTHRQWDTPITAKQSNRLQSTISCAFHHILGDRSLLL